MLAALVPLCLSVGLLQAPPAVPEGVDPALRAAVERFFATQQAEDVDGYLALWSAATRRPHPMQVKYVFDAGDDVYRDVRITQVAAAGERARVRVSALRERTETRRTPTGEPITRTNRIDVSLGYVRENGEWKLTSEGPASDYLAASLLESTDAEERRKLLEADPGLVTEQLILSLARRAADAAQKQDYAAALTGYERMLEAARHLDHRKYEGEALQNLGNTLYFRRNLPAALEAYEQRLAIERERGDEEGAAAAYGGIATIRYSFAEYGAALAAYREALAIQERLEDEPAVAATLISTGNVLYLQGDFNGAIADYTRSRELYRKTANPDGEARALDGLGRVHLARGDYAGALEAFTGVLAEGRARRDRQMQGSATMNLGDAHFRLGNLDAARETFEECRGHFEAVGDAANVGRAWQAVALTDLVGGRYQLSEDEYTRSIASCAGAADRECVAGATVGLGFAQAAQEKFVDAIANYRKAVQGFTALNRKEQAARARIGLSQALAGSGDFKGALAASGEARQAGVGLGNDDVLWRALIAEARALRRLGEPAEALAAARAAESTLQHQVEGARIQPGNPVARDSSTIFTTLALLHAEAGDAAAAFDTVERMRVHDLRLRLAGVEREIARGMTEEEREEERAIAADLVSLQAQLGREKGLPKPDAERLARLERSIGEATGRHASFERRLFERLPDLRIWRGLMVPATNGDAEGVLEGEGDLLLQLVVDDEDVLAVGVRRSGDGLEFLAHVRETRRRTLAERVGSLVLPDVLRDEDLWRKASADLLGAIPGAAMTWMSASARVIVIPHEFLWRVPFEAMPIETGYLAETSAVRYAQSLSALVRVPPRQAAAIGGDVNLLIGSAPELHEEVRARVARTAPGWTLRSADGAAFEAKAVSGEAPAAHVTALAGADLTEAALRAHFASADAIHLAAPFRINSSGPVFSRVLLAGAAAGEAPPAVHDSTDDGSLDPREVMNLQLAARAIVLSDGTAMMMRDAADGAPVVHWAWRAAGVPSLLMPRWSGDADAANQLLADFHSRLRHGESPDEALAAAQRALRLSHERAAPHHWAGWLLLNVR